MKSTTLRTIFALTWVTVMVRGWMDPRCQNVAMKMMDCFRSQGLTLDLPQGPENVMKMFQQLQQMEVATYCAQLKSMKNAISCALPVVRGCLDVMNMGGIVPSHHTVHQGMEAFCRRSDVAAFDRDCLTNQMASILKCGQNVTQRLQRENSRALTLNQTICLTADINYDCYELHLQRCNPTTREIYLVSMNKYFIPPACVDNPPGRPGRHSYVMASSASALTLGISVVSLLLHLVLRP